MWKYEKHQVKYKGAYACEGYSKLNRLGRQGWEAYCVKVNEFGEIYYLKKHVKQVSKKNENKKH